jgi:hypothetical protein
MRLNLPRNPGIPPLRFRAGGLRAVRAVRAGKLPRLFAAWSALAALALLLLTACDRRRPLEGETDTGKPPVLELSIDKETVTAVKDTFLTVQALLVNSNHGTLAHKRIDFQARVGFISTNDSTNDSGVAQVFYYTRLKSLSAAAYDTIIGSFAYEGPRGQARVYDTLVLRLVPGMQTTGDSVGSLELATSRTAVQVRGTGNNDQAAISARVFDEFGAPVKDGTAVTFRILKGPGGGEVLGGGALDTASTRSGAATVTFRAGTRIGVVEIEAASHGHSARQALLTVTSGPPAQLNIMVRKDSTVNAGTRWIMQVQAVLTDAYLNPVKDSIGVLFTLDPMHADPAGVFIEGSSFTGNPRCGDTTRVDCRRVAGSAFTNIAYRSEVVFDSLAVAAETSTGNQVIRGGLAFRAPLQKPSVRANYYGGAVFAPYPNPVDTLTIHGVLSDGFGYQVPGARLCISTDGGSALDTCQVTNAAGEAAFRMTVSNRDQTSLDGSRTINVTLFEQSTGANGKTSFLTIFN